MLHPHLKRGRIADRLAWVLLIGLLVVLAVSLAHGLGSLRQLSG